MIIYDIPTRQTKNIWVAVYVALNHAVKYKLPHGYPLVRWMESIPFCWRNVSSCSDTV